MQLRGFAKARDLLPSDSKDVNISLDRYAISFWDTSKGAWSARAGKYKVFLGSSSEKLEVEGSFELKKSFYWMGV